jgi:cell division protein ZapA
MADVRLVIAGREYIVTCKDGEEDRLKLLGALVDGKAREAGGSAGGLNESRQLLFASLLLADQLHDSGAPQPTSQSTTDNAGEMAAVLETLADRIETLASDLEQRR